MAKFEYQIRTGLNYQVRIYRTAKTGDIALHLWRRESGTGVWHSTPTVIYVELDELPNLVAALTDILETDRDAS